MQPPRGLTYTAIVWGSVAASFVIEQDGLPELTLASHGSELWNGEATLDRVALMMHRAHV